MTKTVYILHRSVPWILLSLLVPAGASYYLELGWFEPRTAKGITLLGTFLVLIYLTFLAPEKRDMDAHRRPTQEKTDA